MEYKQLFTIIDFTLYKAGQSMLEIKILGVVVNKR
jgi:hypothetical protein